jgi:hypothetical protein
MRPLTVASSDDSVAVPGPLQPLGIRDAHTTVLAAPQIEARLREAALAAQLLHRQSLIGFLEKPDDLLR